MLLYIDTRLILEISYRLIVMFLFLKINKAVSVSVSVSFTFLQYNQATCAVSTLVLACAVSTLVLACVGVVVTSTKFS